MKGHLSWRQSREVKRLLKSNKTLEAWDRASNYRALAAIWATVKGYEDLAARSLATAEECDRTAAKLAALKANEPAVYAHWHNAWYGEPA